MMLIKIRLHQFSWAQTVEISSERVEHTIAFAFAFAFHSAWNAHRTTYKFMVQLNFKRISRKCIQQHPVFLHRRTNKMYFRRWDWLLFRLVLCACFFHGILHFWIPSLQPLDPINIQLKTHFIEIEIFRNNFIKTSSCVKFAVMDYVIL